MTVRELYDLLALHVAATPDMPVILEGSEWTLSAGEAKVVPLRTADMAAPVACLLLSQEWAGDDWWIGKP